MLFQKLLIMLFLVACVSVVFSVSVSSYSGLQRIEDINNTDIQDVTTEHRNDSCFKDSDCDYRQKCLESEEQNICVCADGLGGKHCENLDWCEEIGKFKNCKDDNGTCYYAKEKRSVDCLCESRKILHPVENICTECDCGFNGFCGFENAKKVCDCAPGYVYMNGTCTDPCISMPCKNEGICKQEGGSFICHCKPPYFGTLCEKDPCTQNPCLNGGTCFQIGYSFKCLCRHPYSGDICQYDACNDNPCFNGGTCYKDGHFFKCKCRNGYYGIVCEKEGYEITPEETVDSTTKPDNISISTVENYTDATNEITELTHDFNWTTIRPGICTRDTDCLNGGVCKYGHCDCPPNFGGYWCDRSFLCESLKSTCRTMGATCKIVGLNAICDCPQDKMYHPKSGMCEDICDPWKCQHGRCEIDGRTYKCICDTGYKGERCNESEEAKTKRSYVWFAVLTTLMVIICLLLIAQMYLSLRKQKYINNSTEIPMEFVSSRSTTSDV